MKPKQMVCDLKIAERLKNAGVEQNSMFYWICQPQGNKLVRDCTKLEYKGVWLNKYAWEEKKNQEGVKVTITSAFTSEELALKIPEGISQTQRYANKFFVYFLDSQGEIVSYEEDKTESNARAKMLLNLIQHKFIRQ